MAANVVALDVEKDQYLEDQMAAAHPAVDRMMVDVGEGRTAAAGIAADQMMAAQSQVHRRQTLAGARWAAFCRRSH